MTTIIMLPTAAAPPARATQPTGSGGQDTFGPALDRAIDADRRAERRDDAGRADRADRADRRDAPTRDRADDGATRRPGDRDGAARTTDGKPTGDTSTGRADGATEPATDGTESSSEPRTVTEIVQAAADLLADVGGAKAPEAQAAATGASGATDPDGAIAEVIELDSRRHPAAAAKVAGAQGPAAGAAGAVPATATGVGAVPGTPATAVEPGVVTTAAPTTAPAAAAPAAATVTADPSALQGTDATDLTAATTRTAAAPAEAPAATSSGSTAPAPVTHSPAAGGGVGHAHVNATAEATPTAPATAPSAPGDPRALADQLGVRLASLRGAGPGQHTLTLRVDPESFGPVRVVAHIGTEGVRIELLGATDQAREALKAALPDLRRDLTAAGLPADLDLGEDRGTALQGQGTDADGGTRGGTSGDRANGTGTSADRTGVDPRPAHHSPVSDRLVGLDLLV